MWIYWLGAAVGTPETSAFAETGGVPGRYESRALTLLVYEPLVRGTGPISDDLGYSVERLRVEHAAFGGYWSLTFTLRGRQSQVEDWVNDGLGRHVELYDTNLALIFEGFADRVQANIGSLSLTRGPLMKVANRIKCVYSTVDTSTTPPTVGVRDDTAWQNDTDSQDKYGILEYVISVGGADATTAEQIRDVALEDMREPAADERENLRSSAAPSATVTCLGYFHWLNAYTVDLTTVGTQRPDQKVEAVLAADPNNIFSTDYSYVTDNLTSQAIGAYDRDDRMAMTVIRGLTALGDGGYDRWLFGFGPGRRAFYNVIPSDTVYQRRLSDPEQRLEVYGTESQVFPWNAEAGEWLFYTDLLVGRTPPADRRADPRYLFIEQATFTAPWALTLRGSRQARLAQLLAQKGLGGTHA